MIFHKLILGCIIVKKNLLDLSNMRLLLSFIIYLLYKIPIPGNEILPLDNQHLEIIMSLKSS